MAEPKLRKGLRQRAGGHLAPGENRDRLRFIDAQTRLRTHAQRDPRPAPQHVNDPGQGGGDDGTQEEGGHERLAEDA